MPSAIATRGEELARLARATGRKRPAAPALHDAARALLRAWAAEPEDRRGVKRAIAHLDEALGTTRDEAHAELLRLVLGGMVESGLDPALVWRTAERGLVEALALALRGRRRARPLAREEAAWASLGPRALLAVACLAHSAPLRARARRRAALVSLLEQLHDEHDALAILLETLSIEPDQTMLVLHPDQRRGYRVLVSEVATVGELYVLLADAVFGAPTAGLVKAPRPSKQAIRVVVDPDHDVDPAPRVPRVLDLHCWTSLRADLTLDDPAEAAARPDLPPPTLGLAGMPWDLPVHGGERVILLGGPSLQGPLDVERSHPALTPRVTVLETLSRAAVDRTLRTLAKDAAVVRARYARAAARARA